MHKKVIASTKSHKITLFPDLPRSPQRTPSNLPKEHNLLEILHVLTYIQNNPHDLAASERLLTLSNSLNPNLMDTLFSENFFNLKIQVTDQFKTNLDLAVATHNIEIKIGMANLIRQLEKLSFSCQEKGPITEMDRDGLYSRNTIFEIWSFKEHETLSRRLSHLYEAVYSIFEYEPEKTEKIRAQITILTSQNPNLKNARKTIHDLKKTLQSSQETDMFLPTLSSIQSSLENAVIGYIKVPYLSDTTHEELVVTALAKHLGLSSEIALTGNYNPPIALQDRLDQDPRVMIQTKQPGITLRDLIEDKTFANPTEALRSVPLSTRQKLALFSLLIGVQDGHPGNATLQQTKDGNTLHLFDFEGCFPDGQIGLCRNESGEMEKHLPFVSMFLFDPHLETPLLPSVKKWITEKFNTSLIECLKRTKTLNHTPFEELLTEKQKTWLLNRAERITHLKDTDLKQIINDLFPLTLDVFQIFAPELHTETLQMMQKPFSILIQYKQLWNRAEPNCTELVTEFKNKLSQPYPTFDASRWTEGIDPDNENDLESNQSQRMIIPDTNYDSDSHSDSSDNSTQSSRNSSRSSTMS